MMLCPKPELKPPPPVAFPPLDVLPPKILPPAEDWNRLPVDDDEPPNTFEPPPNIDVPLDPKPGPLLCPKMDPPDCPNVGLLPNPPLRNEEPVAGG